MGGGGVQGVWTPRLLKNHKNIGFLNNTGPDPLKNYKLPSQIQCWAVIGTPVKRLRADDGTLIAVFESSLPSSTKKKKKKNVF